MDNVTITTQKSAGIIRKKKDVEGVIDAHTNIYLEKKEVII